MLGLLLCLSVVFGCENVEKVSNNDTAAPATTGGTEIVDQIVEVSCGECQFGMEGSGCDVAVRIHGKSYYVDGSSIDDHGDAHGEDGLCNCVRQAKVSGEIRSGRFVATSLEVLPVDKEHQAAAKLEQLKKSRLGAAFAMSGQGLVVKDIWEDGAAGKAGLKKGDKIVKLNDKSVAEMNPESLRAVFAESETVTFSIKRDGEKTEILVRLPKKS
jgi:hypothetical protein